MATEEKLVKVEVTRRYPREGIEYPPGEVIEVPEHVAASMEEASPPWGKRVIDAPAAARARGTAPSAPAPGA